MRYPIGDDDVFDYGFADGEFVLTPALKDHLVNLAICDGKGSEPLLAGLILLLSQHVLGVAFGQATESGQPREGMYTPGPWKYKTTPGSDHGYCTVYAENGRAIASYVLRADAAAITALPDLLAACKALCGDGGDGLSSARHQQGMAAIAKAEGNQKAATEPPIPAQESDSQDCPKCAFARTYWH